jgi:hypothetical protein
MIFLGKRKRGSAMSVCSGRTPGARSVFLVGGGIASEPRSCASGANGSLRTADAPPPTRWLTTGKWLTLRVWSGGVRLSRSIIARKRWRLRVLACCYGMGVSS